MRFLAAVALSVVVCAGADPAQREVARSVLKELIEINTTDSIGDNTAAAEAMAQRFRAAGYPAGDVAVVAPAAKKGNVVVRLRGTGAAKPVLFLAHLDVVEARREDWSMDPFILHEKDGFFYGRGTQDMKGEAALLVASFLRLKQEGYRPERDLILALTADEEGGRGPNGVQWLVQNRRDLIDAEFCVNHDAGGGQERNGKRELYAVQAAEKGYASFYLRATNSGGHSSLPVADNAIYELAEALVRVKALRFPVDLNEVTRAYFERTGKWKAPSEAEFERLSRDAYDNALLRTTCVATMLRGGHADNALPQLAEATVNCRVLPGETQETVAQKLREAIGPKVQLSVKIPLAPNPASPPRPEILKKLGRVVDATYPGLKIVPVMETGGTDGKPLRGAGIPTYGMAAMCYDLGDIRAHGRDERIPVAAFYEGLDFAYRLVKEMGQAH